MRRAVARGRVFPQSYSTDRRYGRLSLKSCALFPLMWANADDQGRLPGDPEEIKYAACPNIDHITKADIPELLEDLDKNQLIKVYNTSRTTAIQLLDWWEVQKLQWAWPSQYPAMEGWQDSLRYKKSAREVVTQNWPASGEAQTDAQVSTQVKAQVSKELSSGEASGEPLVQPPLTTPIEKETRRGKGKSPERSGEPSPESAGKKPADPTVNEIIAEMKSYLGYPGTVDKDPIPSYGKEGQAIKRILARGFTREEVTVCWKQKVDARGGEFVSMTWVNEDIGKKGVKAGEGKDKRAKVHSREDFGSGKW